MSLNIDERDAISTLFLPTIKTENLREHLDEEVYNLLKNQQNLKTVRDNILFLNKNQYRPYDSVTITKFLTPNFNTSITLEQFFEILSPPFLVFVDFHFLFECTPDENNENRKNRLKFQSASKASCINSTIKVSTTENFESIINEFKNKNHADLLNTVFQHHVDLYEYEDSGFCPYQLLSLVVHVQKFPKS